MDLAQDFRLTDAVRLDVGAVLAPEDIIADKVLALWGRAEARDLLDVDALAARFGHERLLQLAAEKDPGFDPALLPGALAAAASRDPDRFASLEVTRPALDRLRARADAWAAQLAEQHGGARSAAQLAAEAFPAALPQQPVEQPSTAVHRDPPLEDRTDKAVRGPHSRDREQRAPRGLSAD